MSPSHLPYAQSEHRSSFNMGAQPAHAPESSASISVDGRSRPMEPGTQSTRHSLYSLNGIQGSGSGSSSASVMTGSEGRFSQSFNLVKFYMDRDGPWHPLSKNSTDSRLDDSRGRNQSLLFGSGMASNFSSWRESVPSECDTIGPDALMSDSGYGSMAKASVGIPSHYGGEFDHNLETHSIIGHFSDIQLHGSDKGPWGHQSASQSQAGSDRLTCQTCLKQVKNRSELNKHNLRHTKPYSCDIPGCQRDRGFSTKNDLARHKESVHKTNGIKYVCNLGPCKSKNKIWPRADNFRQHLKRIHNRPIAADDEELRSFIYTSPDEEASSASYEQPLASNVQESRLSPPHWGLGPSREEHMGIVDDSSPDSIGRCEGLAYSGRDGHTENSFFPLSAEEDDHDDEQSVPLDTLAGDSLQFQHMLPHDPVSQLPTCSSTSLGGSPASGFSCIPPDALSHASLHEEPQRDSNDRCKVIDLVSDETTIPNLSEQQDCFKDDLLAEDPHHKPSLELLQTEETSVAIEPDASRVDIAEKREASSPGGLSSLPTEETNDPAILAVLEETQNPEESPAPESKPQVDALVAGTGAHDDEDVSNILKLLQEKGLLEKALGHLGYQKKDQSSKPKKPVGLKTPVVENNYVQCTECHKTFKRKCELKKHSKRHERPYGCTHPGCPKRFGSKNDWKRHENSQHFMLAVWKCEEKLADNPSQLCGKACYRRETFRHHLQKSHSITDAKITEEKLESCRLGQNCESRFWCGFCEMKIEVKGKGGEAWTERFNHIDDHFSGRKAPKKDIKDWKNVDPAGPNTDEYTSSSDAGSRAGTPELLADGRDGRSATTVTPSPAGGARKRAIDDAADGEPDAKRRKGVGIWWFCCQCRTQNTVVTNSSCMESVCNHDRCVSCKLENHRVQEYEEDGERSSQ